MFLTGCNLAHLYGRTQQQATRCPTQSQLIAGHHLLFPSQLWLSCSPHSFFSLPRAPSNLILTHLWLSCFAHPSLSSVPAASPGPSRGEGARRPHGSTFWAGPGEGVRHPSTGAAADPRGEAVPCVPGLHGGPSQGSGQVRHGCRDRRGRRGSPADLAWACMLILKAAVLARSRSQGQMPAG